MRISRQCGGFWFVSLTINAGLSADRRTEFSAGVKHQIDLSQLG